MRSGVGFSLARIWAICIKEITQLRRDRLTFAMVVIIPLMQLLMFGYSINTKVRNIPIAVCDHSASSFSRQLAEDVQASQVVTISSYVDHPETLHSMVRNGEVSAGLYIPQDSERRYYAEDKEAVAQLIVDGSDTVMASALKSLGHFPFIPGGVSSFTHNPGDISVTLLYNPAQRSELNTVPGLLGLILTMTMVMFTAIAIVRERERGNMELLIATPVHTVELMLGKLIPYVFIGLIQMGIILWLGQLLFQVPVSGSWILLITSCLLFIFANLGLGLLLSTIAPNQMGAMQLFIFIFLPSILLSGFMFPYQGMPVLAQKLAELLPMTHFMRIIRGIILRDAEWSGIQADMRFLAGFFIVTLSLAILRFRQRLD
ncbi:ABC transporter permease [Verrucomicrobiaceae bacterium N1E253]|uniref:Transport permease protein n=1 Tax=Oceaniferula marina TaxID=2748318 RepID=A0A851GEW2_9BACT|nr:ABC transporter permease [Oceaniferula marina]NWK56073.1 ABC transporter permease [Oceaniferula marina]